MEHKKHAEESEKNKLLRCVNYHKKNHGLTSVKFKYLVQESFYKHLDSPPLVTISCRQLHNPEVQELLLRLWKVICSEFGGKIGEQEFCMLLDRLQSGMQSNIFNAVNLHLLDAYLIYFVSVLRTKFFKVIA